MGQQNIWPSASVIVARNSLPENGSVSLKCIGNHWCSFTSSCAYPYLWKGDLIKSNKPNMWGNKNFSTSTKLRKMLTHSLSRCIQLQPTNLPVILSHSNITHILCCFYVILRFNLKVYIVRNFKDTKELTVVCYFKTHMQYTWFLKCNRALELKCPENHHISIVVPMYIFNQQLHVIRGQKTGIIVTMLAWTKLRSVPL